MSRSQVVKSVFLCGVALISLRAAEAKEWSCAKLDHTETQVFSIFKGVAHALPNYTATIKGRPPGATVGMMDSTSKGGHFYASGYAPQSPGVLEAIQFYDVTGGDPEQAAKSSILCKKIHDRGLELRTQNPTAPVDQVKVSYTSICKEFPRKDQPSKMLNAPTILECKLNGEVPADLLAQTKQELEAVRAAAAAAAAAAATPPPAAEPAPTTTGTPPVKSAPATTMTRGKAQHGAKPGKK